MPNALRPVRHEEIQAGEFVWVATGVELGHDGFKNLLYNVIFAQGGWTLFQSVVHHQLVEVFDTVTSRISARQEALDSVASVTSTIRKRILLPPDFGFFPAVALKLITKVSDPVPDAYTISIVKNGVVDPGVSAVSIKPVLGDTFEFFEFSPTGEYFPGDLVTLEVKLETSLATHFGEIADVELEFKTARGNV